MSCLRCGKETDEDQVFCSHCLEIMEEYPVKSTAGIHLPDHSKETPSKKSPRRKFSLSPDEQLIHLKRAVRNLIIAVTVLSLLLVLTVGVMGKMLHEAKKIRHSGQNYVVETTSAATVAETP